MKVLIAFVLIVVGLLAVNWIEPDATPLVVVGLVGLSVLALYLRVSVQKNPAWGWQSARAWGILGVCLGVIWTLLALAGGSALAFPAMALFFLSAWGGIYATRQLDHALGRTPLGNPAASQTTPAAPAHSSSVAEARRIEDRGKMIDAQRQAIQLSGKVNDLEKENARLQRKVAALENELLAATTDPFHDPLPKAGGNHA